MSSARNWVCGAAMTAMSLAAWAAPRGRKGIGRRLLHFRNRKKNYTEQRRTERCM